MVGDMRRWVVRDDHNKSLFVGLTSSNEAIFTSDFTKLLAYAIDRVSSFGSEEEAADFIALCFDETDASHLTIHPVESKDSHVTNLELVKAGFWHEARPLLLSTPVLTNTLH